MIVIGLLFGMVAGWACLRFFDLHTQANAIHNAAIVQGFGVRIPDPRPTIERALLEGKATAYAGLAAVSGVIALSTLLGVLLIRPPRRLPRHQGTLSHSSGPPARRRAASIVVTSRVLSKAAAEILLPLAAAVLGR